MKRRMRMLVALLVTTLCLTQIPGVNWVAGAETVPSADAGDFHVTGNQENYSFDAEQGVLFITGDVSVGMKEGIGQTGQSIIVANDAVVTLDGIHIQAEKGPAILIQSPHSVTLVLAEGSENEVIGAHGVDINRVAGSFAGIEVEFEYESGENPQNRMASLTIEGTGTLTATGHTNAAGIGGSNSAEGSKGEGLYGNITINGGTVTATSPNAGAGIGSSDNPEDGTSSGSYKKTGYNTWGTITINGGTITAKSGGSGAGIGGGNHVDSGRIVINGGTITADGAAGIGCGIGSSKNKGDGGDKGPGYYYADVEINGGNITATSNDIGAAIGGGMYCDAKVLITGGVIKATGGDRAGNTHHGGAGIGGGYLGHAEVTITGGTITAVGGDGAAGIGSGGSPNSTDDRGSGGRSQANGITLNTQTAVIISGGVITATGGVKGGAGIGLGVGADKGSVSISGGTIRAYGAASSNKEMHGGAGIGSGFQGRGTGNSKYFTDADISVSITGGDVLAVGGWGAAGIGSGANNKMADEITITDSKNADGTESGLKLEAYADGTKFAIDTRVLNDDGSTTSRTEGRTYTGDFLQGTFVHAGKIGDKEQNPEGLKSIQVIHDQTGETVTLTQMPESYRSFALDVAEPGNYNVYTDESSIGEGEGRYFSESKKDVYQEDEVLNNGVKYRVETDRLCDNFYLYPVKSIVVSKSVIADKGLELAGINKRVYFALKMKNTDGSAGDFVKKADGTTWIESIAIQNGIPQSRAFFPNIQDATYDIWEVDENGNPISAGTAFDFGILKKITTKHGDDTTNNATISEKVWTDQVTVENTYEPLVGLTLTEVVEEDNAQAPGDAVFHFTGNVTTMNGTDIYYYIQSGDRDSDSAAEKPDYIQVKSGTEFGIDLKNGETAHFLKFPEGTTYVFHQPGRMLPDGFYLRESTLEKEMKQDAATGAETVGILRTFAVADEGTTVSRLGETVSGEVGGNELVHHVTYFNPYAEVTAEGGKTWVEKDRDLSLRPSEITVHLLAALPGEDKEAFRDAAGNTVTATATENSAWRYSFSSLPAYRHGEQLTYSVSEEPVSGYITTALGMDVTNTKIGHGEIGITKIDAVSGEQLEGAEFTLMAQEIKDAQPIVIRTGEDGTAILKADDDLVAPYLPATPGGITVFVLRETAAPAGYLLDSHTEHQVVIQAVTTKDDAGVESLEYQMTVDGASTAVIRNERDITVREVIDEKYPSIKVTKYGADQDGKNEALLTDKTAVFGLYGRKEDGTDILLQEFEAGTFELNPALGTVKGWFDLLHESILGPATPGAISLYIQEKEAPEDYERTDEKFELTVWKDAKTQIDRAAGKFVTTVTYGIATPATEHTASGSAIKVVNTKKPEEPEEPKEPEEPEEPKEPEEPEEPEEPKEPEKPEKPEEPEEPENPGEPDTTTPDTPVVNPPAVNPPTTPTTPTTEVPDEPENPSEPDDPETPETEEIDDDDTPRGNHEPDEKEDDGTAEGIDDDDIPRGSFDGDDEQNHKGGLGADEEAAARSPKTGDANSLLMLFGTMIAAVGTMYTARKRKED